MIDVTILTDERYVNPKKSDAYISNVLLEDQLVMDGLKKRGLTVARVAWSDGKCDWSQTKAVIFRSTWDYAERFEEFSKWLDQVSKKTLLINDNATIRWNLDKHYLNDLVVKGINIVESYFIEKGDKRSLVALHKELKWERTVLKPAISAAAKDTYKLSPALWESYENIYQGLIENESMMLQPFLNDIVMKGEISLVLIGGEFTHAVLKKSKPGDFRVQDDFGGTVHDYEPTQKEIDLAIAAVNTCEEIPIYARVDIVNDNNGSPAISELELFEPELWFRRNEAAAMKFAIVVKELLTSKKSRLV